ncbi:MAG: LysM peptidoglycan-binding domain-containing protein [Candidatus Promineifilaceae bacterium]|nr:LysM peptidoglycan-binding domain-containing protein [Candidatus Promineifilaceae bacterium]
MIGTEQDQSDAPGEIRLNILFLLLIIASIALAAFFSQADDLYNTTTLANVPDQLAAALPTATAVIVTPTPTPTIDPTPTTTPTATQTAGSLTNDLSRQQQTTLASSTPRSTATPVPVRVRDGTGCPATPVDWHPYLIRRGDTLFKIASRTGSTVNELIQANCLELNLLIAGARLYVPESPPQRAQCGPPRWWQPYQVQPGDTLFSLARSRNTTVYAVMQANCLLSTRIFYGRLLYLPAGQPPISASATPAPQPTDSAPAPTSTPRPSATPRPTEEIVPTASMTATPTNTPVPSATATPPPPSPSATPTETLTPTATPTDTPVPSNTPTSTSTPTDTPEPTPTNTPLPSDTPAPTSTVTPTPTSESAEQP